MIPLTDSNHDLLTLQFAIDPGENFVWNRDEMNDDLTKDMILHPTGHLNLLSSYLEVVKVTLPEWVFEGDSGTSRPASQQQLHHKKHPNKVGIGSIGKKLRKNLGRLARNGSFKSNKHHQQQQVYEERISRPGSSCSSNGRIVSANQEFILAALIHTNQTLPYQNKMVENYLEVSDVIRMIID